MAVVAVLQRDFQNCRRLLQRYAACPQGGRGEIAVGKKSFQHRVEVEACGGELQNADTVLFNEMQGLKRVGEPIEAVGDAQAGADVRRGHHGVPEHAVGLGREEGRHLQSQQRIVHNLYQPAIEFELQVHVEGRVFPNKIQWELLPQTVGCG